jgi:hypothetical protein
MAAVQAITAERRRPRARRFPLPVLSLVVLSLVILALAAARNAPVS